MKRVAAQSLGVNTRHLGKKTLMTLRILGAALSAFQNHPTHQKLLAPNHCLGALVRLLQRGVTLVTRIILKSCTANSSTKTSMVCLSFFFSN